MIANILFKRSFLLLALLVFSTTVSGCRKEQSMKELQPEMERNAKVRDAIHNGLASDHDAKVQAWHEFLSHWPSAKQNLGFAWYEDMQKFQGGVDATAVIEKRYTLQIILDCDVSKDYKEMTFTKLRFHFTEVKAVRPSPKSAKEGGAMVIYETSSDRWFGLKEWDQLKESTWDFSKIGITVISNSPIPNIQSSFQ